MSYLLLIYESEKEAEQFSQEKFQELLGDFQTFTENMREQGLLENSKALMPTSSATTVKVRNGRTLITDGPFAETKEQLTGYYLLDCKNLEEAIALAKQIPTAAHGSIEIRPTRTFSS